MSALSGRILIADDASEVVERMGQLVSRAGLTPLLARNGMDALQLIRANAPDVLLADMGMPGMDGMELMRRAKELDPELPVVLTTNFAEVHGAVEALRAGAHDYLAKPFEQQEVMSIVFRALNERQLNPKLTRTTDRFHAVLSPREAFGPSGAIGKVIEAIEKVAKSNFSVLINGETGAGKEMVARAVHQASNRARQPFVPVDCGAVPEALFESELFGHERGAFTGADQTRPPCRWPLAPSQTVLERSTRFLSRTGTSSTSNSRASRARWRWGCVSPWTCRISLSTSSTRTLSCVRRETA